MLLLLVPLLLRVLVPLLLTLPRKVVAARRICMLLNKDPHHLAIVEAEIREDEEEARNNPVDSDDSDVSADRRCLTAIYCQVSYSTPLLMLTSSPHSLTTRRTKRRTSWTLCSPACTPTAPCASSRAARWWATPVLRCARAHPAGPLLLPSPLLFSSLAVPRNFLLSFSSESL